MRALLGWGRWCEACEQIDSDPWDGMECSIFGKCSSEQKVDCFEQAGHCLVLDEIDHKLRVVAAKTPGRFDDLIVELLSAWLEQRQAQSS